MEGYLSGMANTFSGFLVTSKNIYLNNSLNYNLNQVNKILSSLITEDTNKDVRDVMNYFFEKNKDSSIMSIKEDLKEKIFNYKITHLIIRNGDSDNVIKNSFKISSQLTKLIEAIEDNIKKLDLGVLKELDKKGYELLNHICFAISNIISLQLQYDSGTIGYTIKMLICDTYPDKTDALLMHLFKLLPNFILDLLLSPDQFLKLMKQKSKNIIKAQKFFY